MTTAICEFFARLVFAIEVPPRESGITGSYFRLEVACAGGTHKLPTASAAATFIERDVNILTARGWRKAVDGD